MNLSGAHFHAQQDVEAVRPDGVDGSKSMVGGPVA
jgi:hypothetical protein